MWYLLPCWITWSITRACWDYMTGRHGCVQGMPQSWLQVNSGMLCWPINIQGLPRRCLDGTSNFRVEANGSFKMASSVANQNCSFDCKWKPPYGGHHFEKPLQPIRVVLLIRIGSPVWTLPFSTQKWLQSKETNRISPWHLRGGTMNQWEMVETFWTDQNAGAEIGRASGQVGNTGM